MSGSDDDDDERKGGTFKSAGGEDARIKSGKKSGLTGLDRSRTLK